MPTGKAVAQDLWNDLWRLTLICEHGLGAVDSISDVPPYFEYPIPDKTMREIRTTLKEEKMGVPGF